MVIIGKRIHSTDISDVEMEIKEIKRKIDRQNISRIVRSRSSVFV